MNTRRHLTHLSHLDLVAFATETPEIKDGRSQLLMDTLETVRNKQSKAEIVYNHYINQEHKSEDL